MQKIQVQSLGQDNPLEWEVATHSSILAWKVPWTEEPSGASPLGPKELDTTEQLHTHTCYSTSYHTSGNAHVLNLNIQVAKK